MCLRGNTQVIQEPDGSLTNAEDGEECRAIVLGLFDYNDASVPLGNRPTTTVAPQALFLMNSELVADSAEALAMRLLERTDLDDAGRVRLLYETCFGRPPREDELARAAGFVGQPVAAATADDPADSSLEVEHRKTWAALCQAALASNEFLFVR